MSLTSWKSCLLARIQEVTSGNLYPLSRHLWEQITKGIWLIYINQLIEMLLQLQQIRLVIHHYISHRFYHSFVMHE